MTGVVRDAKKADDLRRLGAAVEVADAFDLPALQSALRKGTAVFILTPETGYYGSWLPYLGSVKEHGGPPTLYPVELKIPMVSPLDVAQLVAGVMTEQIADTRVDEVEGPDRYSSADVAAAFGEVRRRQIKAHQIPKSAWGEQSHKIGFTEDAAKNFITMTNLVISGKAGPEKAGTLPVKTSVTLTQYLASRVSLWPYKRLDSTQRDDGSAIWERNTL